MEILTVDEVAGLLKLKRETVYELTRDRSQKRQAHPLPHMRIAGKLRFNKAAIIEWLQKLQQAI
jgi:excisionase family DNA binding protein